MLLQEEISRVRELMLIKEAPVPAVGGNISKKFATQLLDALGRLQKNLTDDELKAYFRRNLDEADALLKKLRDADTPQAFKNFIDELTDAEVAAFIKNVDLRKMSTATLQGPWGTALKRGYENKIASWANLSAEQFKKEFEGLVKQWKELIVDNGMGMFGKDNPMPLEFKEYYEYLYQDLLLGFRNSVEKARPGSLKVIDDVITDYQDYLNTRTWNNIVPLTPAQINRLASKNKGFLRSLKQLQQNIVDYFTTKTALVEELTSLIRTLGEGQIRNPAAVKQRISEITLLLQKRDKEFFELLDRWIDTNIVGMPKLKNELKSLPGYAKAKKLSDGETAQKITEAYGTYLERSRNLRRQFKDLLFSWGENWKKKYGDEMGKFRTILNSDAFKELRASALPPGTTISLQGWYRISKELGIPATVAKLGKEAALRWLFWTMTKAAIATIYDMIVTGLYVAYPTNAWLQSQALDEEDNPVWGGWDTGDETVNKWVNLATTFSNEFVNQMSWTSGVFPGWADDVIMGVVNLSDGASKAFGLDPEKQKELEEKARQEFEEAKRKKEELENGGGQSGETQPQRVLIPNELETLFPEELVKNLERDGALTVGKFKYVVMSRDGKKFEYPIQKITFDGVEKWGINLSAEPGTQDWYPLDRESVMASIIGASR